MDVMKDRMDGLRRMCFRRAINKLDLVCDNQQRTKAASLLLIALPD